MLRVTVTRAGGPFLQVQLPHEEILIGRGDGVDVSLPSEAVSRRHARLAKRDGGWQVSDLGAANGVYVLPAGTDEAERIVLRALGPGDRIQIENFVLSCEEVAGESPTGAHAEGNAPDAVATTARTQFISMVDVLAARDAAAAADAADAALKAATTQPPVAALGEPRPAVDGTTLPPAAASSAATPVATVASVERTAPAAAPQATSPSTIDRTPTVPTTSSTTPAGPSPSPRGWRVHMTSAAGHDQNFVITSDRATVGALPSCDVVLPSGPPMLLELVRIGAEVELHRRRWWPFPKITLDGHRVTRGAISPGDALCVGIFELTVHLRDGE